MMVVRSRDDTEHYSGRNDTQRTMHALAGGPAARYGKMYDFVREKRGVIAHYADFIQLSLTFLPDADIIKLQNQISL